MAKDFFSPEEPDIEDQNAEELSAEELSAEELSAEELSAEELSAEELAEDLEYDREQETRIAEFELELHEFLDRKLAIYLQKHGRQGSGNAFKYNQSKKKNIDRFKLFRLWETGCNSNIEDLIECYLVEPPNGYAVLARLGAGAFKTAFYAVNTTAIRACTLLMIDPIENGILWYRNSYPDLSDEEILEKIKENEFSMLELREHPEIRYVAKPSGPMPGKNCMGKEVPFLEVAVYEKTLKTRLKNGELNRETAFKYILQIALALRDCHNAGFIFKDFKPTNIGVTKNDTIVLADFGRTDTFSEDENSSYFCPLPFRPPELAHPREYWKENPSQSQAACFSPELNIWNLGILVYRFFTGKYPFDIPSREGIVNGSKQFHDRAKYVYEQIGRFSEMKDGIFATLQSINPDARTIAQWCLQENPSDRKGALDKIINLLQNPPNGISGIQ